MVAIAAHDKLVGIRSVSEQTGLSPDTLRWYEREGVLPAVERSSDGRRRYSAALVRFVRLVQALRRTGMPVGEVRRFVQLMDEGAASHGRRMALLEDQAALIDRRLQQLQEDRATIRHKIAHYRKLIDQGLDCNGEPLDQAIATRPQQGAT